MNKIHIMVKHVVPVAHKRSVTSSLSFAHIDARSRVFFLAIREQIKFNISKSPTLMRQKIWNPVASCNLNSSIKIITQVVPSMPRNNSQHAIGRLRDVINSNCRDTSVNASATSCLRKLAILQEQVLAVTCAC